MFSYVPIVTVPRSGAGWLSMGCRGCRGCRERISEAGGEKKFQVNGGIGSSAWSVQRRLGHFFEQELTTTASAATCPSYYDQLLLNHQPVNPVFSSAGSVAVSGRPLENKRTHLVDRSIIQTGTSKLNIQAGPTTLHTTNYVPGRHVSLAHQPLICTRQHLTETCSFCHSF